MRSFQREITKNGFIKKFGPYWYQLTSVWIILHFFFTYQMQICRWSYSHFYFTLVLIDPILHKLLMCFLKCSNLYFVITLKVFYKHCNISGTWWWDNVDPSLPPPTCFSQPAYCLGMSVKILYRHLWIASQSSVIIFQWSVCAEHFVPFHTRSTAEGSLYFRELAAAVEGGFQRKDRRRFRTVSRLRIATRAFLLISSIFVTFSIPHLAPSPLPFWHSFFVIYLSSSEHRLLKLIQFWIGPFLSRSLSLCAERPARLSIINVSASQPLLSTRRNPQNVSLAPPSQPLWTAHIWKCQWANLSATEQVLGSQRALHQSSNPVKIWR